MLRFPIINVTFLALCGLSGAVFCPGQLLAGPMQIPPNQTLAYDGTDELGQNCTVSVSSDASGKLSLMRTHGNTYIDGIIVRLGGSGQGQFIVQDGSLDFAHPGDQVQYVFSDFLLGDGLHIAMHQVPPPGVTGLASDATIDLSGSSLAALTSSEQQGGNVGFFAHAVCKDLVLHD